MCGIVGSFARTNGLNLDSQIDEVKLMIRAQHHRGPDHSAFFGEENLVIGHNRLSIIDLSADSHQPFIYEGLVIVFNGEIYNYIEIRDELIQLGYTFRTKSDTEVILAAYKEWGKNALDHFVGMWSFVIWDKAKGELFCSVDRFGIKPLYYFIDENGTFYFASEVKAFYTLKTFNKKINNSHIKRYLKLGLMHYKNETIFENCFALEPATYMIVNQKELLKEKYWTIDYTKNNDLELKDAVNQFSKLLKRSLKLHMRSDVPLAFSLSGGIDSSSLVSLAAHEKLTEEALISSYHIYYDTHKYNEKKFAEEVVYKYQSQIKPTYYSPSSEELKRDLDHFLYHQEFPVSGSSPFSQYYLNKLINKDNIKVLIEGQGADEYLGGYLHGFYRLFNDKLKSGSLIKEVKGHYKKQELTNKDLASRLLKMASTFVYSEKDMYIGEYKWKTPELFVDNSIPFDIDPAGNTRLDKFLNVVLTMTTLPGLLQLADRNSMAFSIEARVPFLDHRLIEYCASLPNEYLMTEGVTKKILRESVKNCLPQSIYSRYDKVGFVTPGESIWLRNSLSFLLENINFDQFLEFGIHVDKLKSIIDEYKEGNDRYTKLVWRIAILNYWLKSEKQANCPDIEIHRVL